jgi:hypothetical protein
LTGWGGRRTFEHWEKRKVRNFFIATALLLVTATPSSAAMRPFPPHGPPDMRNQFVCKVNPRQGGGNCTTVPYAHLGAACTCDGPRNGVVSTR